MNLQEKIQQIVDNLRCSTCIHFEVCAEILGGADLSIVSEDCRHYKSITRSCEGCCNIAFREPYPSMYPCISCVRANTKDYYNKKVD